ILTSRIDSGATAATDAYLSQACQSTLAIVKPDSMEHAGAIISMVERAGLRVTRYELYYHDIIVLNGLLYQHHH
ncbi:nucleoside diphosphate kinase, partial [Kipferlia bialata]